MYHKYQYTSDSAALSSWLSKEHLQSRGGDGGDVQPVQGVRLACSPSSCPKSKEGFWDTWSWHFLQSKSHSVCETREGCLCTDLGKGAGSGLSDDFLCLSLSVTGLG